MRFPRFKVSVVSGIGVPDVSVSPVALYAPNPGDVLRSSHRNVSRHSLLSEPASRSSPLFHVFGDGICENVPGRLSVCASAPVAVSPSDLSVGEGMETDPALSTMDRASASPVNVRAFVASVDVRASVPPAISRVRFAVASRPET